LLPAGVKAQAFHSSIQEDGSMFRKFLKDESGLELSEYAVAAALIALACVAAFQLLGVQIAAKINTLAGFLQ
jgi:pilus assembly protein Flp/PilA